MNWSNFFAMFSAGFAIASFTCFIAFLNDRYPTMFAILGFITLFLATLAGALAAGLAK